MKFLTAFSLGFALLSFGSSSPAWSKNSGPECELTGTHTCLAPDDHAEEDILLPVSDDPDHKPLQKRKDDCDMDGGSDCGGMPSN